MAISFPSSPNNGDTYVYNGVTYVYDSTDGKWTVTSTSTANVNLAAVETHIVPASNVTYDLGSSTNAFRDLYLSGSSINLGGQTITANSSGIILPQGSSVGNTVIGESTGGGITYVDLLANIPSTPSQGDAIFVNENGTLQVFSGNVWYSIPMSAPQGDEDYSPAGLTPEFQALFNDLSGTITSTYALKSINGTLTYNATGGVVDGFFSGWSSSNFIDIDSNFITGKTYIAWVKSTTTPGTTSYDTGMPIFGDTLNTRWTALGISNGRIDVGNSTAYAAGGNTIDVCDGEWHMLVWVCPTVNSCIGYVDGQQMFSVSGFGSTSYNRVNKIGRSYTTPTSPDGIDTVSIYNTTLSASQIIDIYNTVSP